MIGPRPIRTVLLALALLGLGAAAGFTHPHLEREPGGSGMMGPALGTAPRGPLETRAVKTYLPATLLLLLGWWATPQGEVANDQVCKPFPFRFFLAGLLAGMALTSRLSVAPMMPLMLVAVVTDAIRSGRPWFRATSTWLLGAGLALLPLVYFWRSDPFAFWGKRVRFLFILKSTFSIFDHRFDQFNNTPWHVASQIVDQFRCMIEFLFQCRQLRNKRSQLFKIVPLHMCRDMFQVTQHVAKIRVVVESPIFGANIRF